MSRKNTSIRLAMETDECRRIHSAGLRVRVAVSVLLKRVRYEAVEEEGLR